jgi:hypothetical protein
MRRFKQHAADAFKDWAESGPGDAARLPVFEAMLNDDAWSDVIPGAGPVPDRRPESRYEMGASVVDALAPVGVAEHLEDPRVVAWLAVHFCGVTMYDARGQFFLGKANRHVYCREDAGYGGSRTLRHRHLVRSAAQVVFERGRHAEGMLSGPPGHCSHNEENYASRKGGEFAFMRGNEFFRVFDCLFVRTDQAGRKYVRRNVRHAFERLIDVCAQLDACFDLASMRHAEILALLPTEFDRWKEIREPKFSLAA